MTAELVESPAVSTAPSELLAELAELAPEDQDALLAQIRKARAAGLGLDPVSLFHANARSDLDDPQQAEIFNELSSVKAPPMIKQYPDAKRIALPAERLPLDMSLGEAITTRTSRRDYVQTPIEQARLASLLHYTYAVRRRVFAYNRKDFPFRYTPSAGGLQSTEIYLVANSVEGVERGLYHYNADLECLEQLDRGYLRQKIASCSAFQDFLLHAGAVLILTSELSRTDWKYGIRAYRYVHIDVGILTQQLYLVATGLGLGLCAVAGFSDDDVDELLRLDGRTEFSCLLVGVGTPLEYP